MINQKNSILVVDDEPMNITALSYILGSEYEIFFEINGTDCLKSVKSLKPDLVLLDILMPGMSGFDVMKALKEDPETSHIPVIFITGLNTAEDETRGLSMGAVDYITKPFNDAIVKMRVRNQIALYNQMRSIRMLSTLDNLTGVCNRQHFNSLLMQGWQKAKTNKNSMGLMVLGIQKFGKITEEYGRLCSDILLSEVAQVIDKSLRDTPYTAARWSGNEFAILLSQASTDELNAISESLQNLIKDSAFSLNGHTVKVSICVGSYVAIPSEIGTGSLDDLITCATEAYRCAKLSVIGL